MMKSKYLLLLLGVSVSLFSMEQNSEIDSDTDFAIEMKEVLIDMPTTDNNSRLEQLYTSFPYIKFQEIDRKIVEEGLNEMSSERFDNLQAALRKTSKDRKRFIYNVIARSQAGKIEKLRDNNEKLAAALKHDRKVLACGVPTLGVLLVYAGVISLQYFL